MYVCAISSLLIAVATAGSADVIRLADGKPTVGVYYFTHWWEPWRSSDERILEDLARLKQMGYNTIYLDSEWSQMIDGDWKLLDRGHRLAKQAGMQILPWLSAKVWVDIGSHDYRRDLVKTMYGVELEMGTGPDGKPNRTKPYDPAVIEAGVRYCEQYIERYAKDGALMRVMWNGKACPVVAPTVELEWSGSCDVVTQQMFRMWLRGRYANDIAKLNKAWGTTLKGFEQVDVCDTKLFDLGAHCEGKAAHPNAAEDHVEFRSQVVDNCLAEISRRLRVKYPDLVIATELPYQFNASHPHAIGYRIMAGANPSAASHADILMVRATDSLTPDEEKALLDHRKRTGQKVILTYRTYQEWGKMLLDGKRTQDEMDRLYADQAARAADGFGFYSWNEMVDTHVVADPDPPFHPTSRINEKESEAFIESLGGMAKRYLLKVEGAR